MARKKSGGKKWLQSAIKKPGWTTQWCKKNGFPEVNCACVRKLYSLAKQRNDRTLMGRAMIAARANGGCGITTGDLAKAKRGGAPAKKKQARKRSTSRRKMR